mgnify:CR=1 FL=1
MKKKTSVLSNIYAVLVMVFLYAPIVVLIVFSFNEGKSMSVFTGFSLHWYKVLFDDIMCAIITVASPKESFLPRI